MIEYKRIRRGNLEIIFIYRIFHSILNKMPEARVRY